MKSNKKKLLLLLFILVFKISNAQEKKHPWAIIIATGPLEAMEGIAPNFNLKVKRYFTKNISIGLYGYYFPLDLKENRVRARTDFFYPDRWKKSKGDFREYGYVGVVVYDEPFFIFDLMGDYYFFIRRIFSLYGSLGAGIVTEYGGNPGYTGNMGLGGNLWFMKHLGINLQYIVKKPLFYKGFFTQYSFGVAVKF